MHVINNLYKAHQTSFFYYDLLEGFFFFKSYLVFMVYFFMFEATIVLFPVVLV